MKKWVLGMTAVAMFLVGGCGGGGDGGASPEEGGQSGTAAATLSQSDATATTKAVSSVAMAVMQQAVGSAPAAMRVSKDALNALKDTGALTMTLTGADGGTCSVNATGTSNTSSDPMTIEFTGSISCSDYAGTVLVDEVSKAIVLSGTITASLSGSIAQDYSSVTSTYTISWQGVTVTIAGVTNASVDGNYTLTISGQAGSLTFTESGQVGNQTISATYTYESSTGEEPEAPAEPQAPADTGGPDEEAPETVLVSTSVYVIFAADNQFLGVINNNRYDSDSVCNRYGTYGSRFSSTSIWNRYGSYGSDYASYSPFNDYSSYSPIIYEYEGTILTPLCYLTTNTIKSPRMDPNLLMGLLISDGCDIER